MNATLEATGLVKVFGKTTALNGLDLTMQPGQVLAVLALVFGALTQALASIKLPPAASVVMAVIVCAWPLQGNDFTLFLGFIAARPRASCRAKCSLACLNGIMVLKNLHGRQKSTRLGVL